GYGSSSLGETTIVLKNEKNLDLYAEFADPDHHDYRLQATSRFRGAMSDGGDRGPFPFREEVYFVGPQGDDSADGLSVEQAWGSLEHALAELKAGDTLYLLPGEYDKAVRASLAGADDAPIKLRGRGKKPVLVSGDVILDGSAHVHLERLHLSGQVRFLGARDIRIEQSTFFGHGTALRLDGSTDVRVTHSVFTGFDEAAISASGGSGLFLSGNLYDNADGVAVDVDRAGAIRYSEYNSYRSTAWAWRVGGGVCSLQDGRDSFDRHSRELVPEFEVSQRRPELKNPTLFAAGGPLARPYGPYHETPRSSELKLVSEPAVHSVSATTANIEWNVSLPATTHFSWGPTPEVENDVEFPALFFANYSLTGLKPDTTYYFRIDSLSIPNNVDINLDPVPVNGEVISFTTLPADREPQTYYVSVDGDDAHSGTSPEQAWRTIQHAADRVAVGDTVLIGEGTYRELVRIRATGAEGQTINFRNAPGEKVVIDGDERSVNQAFSIAAKSHLHFDGLYFRQINAQGAFATSPNARWDSWQGGDHGDFNIYRSQNITISRSLSDGRGNGKARNVSAHEVENLLLSNLVAINKFGGAVRATNAPGLRLEHSVFVRPQIATVHIRNADDEVSTLENNIFTDMLKKKSDQNIGLFTVDRSTKAHRQINNLYFIRSFAPEDRALLYGGATASDRPDVFIDPQFGDPVFAGALELIDDGRKTEFMPDLMTHSYLDYTFEHFFPTDAGIVAHGVGLQPDQFVDGNPK
uniref:hypothetical protein n=1 Tax=Roseovarius sp. TaxID=1486281 RepID=UPI0035684F96